MGFFDFLKKKDKILRKQYNAIVSETFGGVKWSEKDYENFAKEAYIRNVIGYRCIYEISKAGAQVEWLIKKETRSGKIEKVKDTPYDNLIKRPNQTESFGFLMFKKSAYLKISGNSYTRKITRKTGPEIERQIPLELHVMRPDKMTVKTNQKGFITGFEYHRTYSDIMNFPLNRVNGDCEILQIKEFHPTDDFYGLSPVEPGSMSIDTNNEATKWNMRLLQNEARIGMIYLFRGILTEEDYDKVEKRIKEFTGADNAGKSLILESEDTVDVKPYMWSPKDIDFIEGWRQTARSTCFAFGVPSELVGIPGDKTYSNYQEARKALWEETNLFMLNFIRGEYNNWLYKNDTSGFMLDYDTNNVPALAEKRAMLWKRAEDSTFLKVNEKREMVGLDPVEGGDVLLIPTNYIPLTSGELPQEPEPGKAGKMIEIEDEKTAREILDIE